MQEIGGVVSVTESRISQLHDQALLRFGKYYMAEVVKGSKEAWEIVANGENS